VEELPAAPSHEVEQGVDGRESADSPPIPVPADRVKEHVRVASNYRFEHLSILDLNPSEQVWGDRTGITKAGTHVGEVGPGDEADAMLLNFEKIAQDPEEVMNLWIIRRELSRENPFVERAAQDREDPDRTFGTEKVLEEDDLEFDRVLCPMGNVIHGQRGTAPLQFLKQVAVCPNRAERCLKIFPAGGKGPGGSGVGRP
jgi:hypothetical protein